MLQIVCSSACATQRSCVPVQAELASQVVGSKQLQQESRAKLEAASQHSRSIAAELAEAREALSR